MPWLPPPDPQGTPGLRRRKHADAKRRRVAITCEVCSFDFDHAVLSLVLSTRLLGTREIMIINHTDCGMLRFTDGEFEARLRKQTGQAPIAPARFYGFTDAEANTREQIHKAWSHPWISPEVPIRGFVYDVRTGRLSEVFPDGETATS